VYRFDNPKVSFLWLSFLIDSLYLYCLCVEEYPHIHFKKNSTRGLAVSSSAVWAASAPKAKQSLRCTDSISQRPFSYRWAIQFIAFVLKNIHTHFKDNSTSGLSVASSAVWSASAPKRSISLRQSESISLKSLCYGLAI
jgi:hypothetical protein